MASRPGFSKDKSSRVDRGRGKRPMNAFLVFCKEERGAVRRKFPNLENREVTKVLAEWWSSLAPNSKSFYAAIANQHKENFTRNHPEIKTPKKKMPAGNRRKLPAASQSVIIPGKLADESQLGGLSSLLIGKEEASIGFPEVKPPLAIPLKKRYRDDIFNSEPTPPPPPIEKEEVKEIKEEKAEPEEKQRTPTPEPSEEDEERLKMWRSHILEENNNMKESRTRACKGQRYRQFMWSNFNNRRKSNRWELNQDKNEPAPPPPKKSKTAKNENNDKSSKISSSSSSDEIGENSQANHNRMLVDTQDLPEAPKAKENDTVDTIKCNGKYPSSNPERFGSNNVNTPVMNNNTIEMSYENKVLNGKLEKNYENKILNGKHEKNFQNKIINGKLENHPIVTNGDAQLSKNVDDNNKKGESAVVTGSRKRKVRKQEIRRLTPGTTLNDIVV